MYFIWIFHMITSSYGVDLWILTLIYASLSTSHNSATYYCDVLVCLSPPSYGQCMCTPSLPLDPPFLAANMVVFNRSCSHSPLTSLHVILSTHYLSSCRITTNSHMYTLSLLSLVDKSVDQVTFFILFMIFGYVIIVVITFFWLCYLWLMLLNK